MPTFICVVHCRPPIQGLSLVLTTYVGCTCLLGYCYITLQKDCRSLNRGSQVFLFCARETIYSAFITSTSFAEKIERQLFMKFGLSIVKD